VAVAPSATGDSGTGDATTPPADRPDRAAHLQEILQPLVDDGTLTQDQVDKVIAALEAAGPAGGPGGRGPGGPERGGPERGAKLDTVATVLGITADEVRTALQGGQTLADLATANGKTADDVVNALVAELKAHLDEEVAAGTHTQDEVDQIFADATTRITDMVNNGAPAGGPGMGDGKGPGGRGHGPRGERPADAPDSTDTTVAGS
jgi:hypothetical protein